MSDPTLSVVMSVCNGQRYLASAVESVLAQDRSDFELVVIDDGSTDATPTILAQYAARDERVRFHSRPNTGIPRAVNEAMGMARGRYIARFDGDDLCLPHRLRRQVEHMDRTGAVCIGSDAQLIDGAGRYLTTLRPPREDDEIQRMHLEGHTSIMQPTAMFLREAVERVGGYDEQYEVAQDLDLWLRMGEIGPLANVPEALVQYRLHTGGISERKRHRQQELMRQACRSAWRRRGIEGRFTAHESWRPHPGDRASYHAFMLRYGWWAFNSGKRSTAMIYGARAVQTRPLTPDSWRLLVCAAIKRTPPQPAT